MSGPFLSPLLRGGAAGHIIRNDRTGNVVARDLITAFDSKTRKTGLLRHESFPEGSAMLIAPSNAVHTFFMRFAIDIAFVTRDGVVVKSYAAVPPWRIAAAFRGYAVIELPAGTLERTGTMVGDRLSVGDGKV